MLKILIKCNKDITKKKIVNHRLSIHIHNSDHHRIIKEINNNNNILKNINLRKQNINNNLISNKQELFLKIIISKKRKR